MGLTGVMVAANWLICRVIPLKEQSHPTWDHTGLDDSSCETSERLGEERLLVLLGELFTNTTNWTLPDGVRVFNASVDRGAVRLSLLVISSNLRALIQSTLYRSCTGLLPPPLATLKESPKRNRRERGTLALVQHQTPSRRVFAFYSSEGQGQVPYVLDSIQEVKEGSGPDSCTKPESSPVSCYF